MNAIAGRPPCTHPRMLVGVDDKLRCPDCGETFTTEYVVAQCWRKIQRLVAAQHPPHLHGLFCHVFGCPVDTRRP